MEYTATCNTFYSTCTGYVGKKNQKGFWYWPKKYKFSLIQTFKMSYVSKCMSLYIINLFSWIFAMAYFISTCAVLWFDRNYIGEIPLVFVFGIATSVSAVHRLLPNAVSSMLCMEKFQAPPSTEYLNMVINQVRHSRYLPLWLTH